MKAVNTQQDGSEQAGCAVEKTSSQRIRRWYREDAKEDGKAAHRELAVSQMYPGAQQNVIESHIALVAPEQPQEGQPRHSGEVDARCFVDPQASCVQQMQAQFGAKQRGGD